MRMVLLVVVDAWMEKLTGLLQNFHTKAALAVCSARANLPPAYNKDGDLRQNKWVGLLFFMLLWT